MAKITCTLSAKVDKQTGKSEILLRMQNRKMGNRRAHSRIWILPQFMNETKGEIEIKARKLTPDVKEAYVQKGKLDKLKNHLSKIELRISDNRHSFSLLPRICLQKMDDKINR